MNCTRIETWLPLYASSDLPALQLAQVRAHLAQCESCAASAEEFVAAHEWLRHVAAPQFDEAFYADLRYAVRQELASQPVRSMWLRLLWLKPCAVAAAVLLLAIFSLRLFQTKGVPRSDIVKTLTSPQQPDAARAPMPLTNQLAQTQKAVMTPRRIVRQRVRAVPQAETAPAEIVASAEPAPAPNTAEPEMLRIEMQTADPNIRIIWLTPKTTNASVDVSAGSLTR